MSNNPSQKPPGIDEEYCAAYMYTCPSETPPYDKWPKISKGMGTSEALAKQNAEDNASCGDHQPLPTGVGIAENPMIIPCDVASGGQVYPVSVSVKFSDDSEYMGESQNADNFIALVQALGQAICQAHAVDPNLYATNLEAWAVAEPISGGGGGK